MIPIIIGALGIVTKGMEQELEDLEISGRVETIQTTIQKSPEDLKRLAVIQTQVENH